MLFATFRWSRSSRSGLGRRRSTGIGGDELHTAALGPYLLQSRYRSIAPRSMSRRSRIAARIWTPPECRVIDRESLPIGSGDRTKLKVVLGGPILARKP